MLQPEMTKMQELWTERTVVPVLARCGSVPEEMPPWPRLGWVGSPSKCLRHHVFRSFGVCLACLSLSRHPELVEG